MKRVESELQIFKALVEQAIDGISFATPDRIVRYANSAFGTMSGYGTVFCLNAQMKRGRRWMQLANPERERLTCSLMMA